MSSFTWPPTGSGNGVPIYPTFGSFPAASSVPAGSLAVAADTGILYESNGTIWQIEASPGGTVIAIGNLDAGTASAKGASISANTLFLQSASTGFPGLVNQTTQSFSGDKTFTGTITASNFSGSSSGTNTGDVTLGVPNGLSIIGQVLSLGLSSTSTIGALSSTDWDTFNGKQASGNYITALTGDGTASGPGSVAFTLATVNSNIGSFGSSTAIPSFTVNAKGLITAASTSAVIAPAGTLTGTTLAPNVVISSLTTVGTIGTGVWQGTAIGIGFGGTGQSTATAAFNALSPITSTGDLIIGNGTNSATRLAIGNPTEVLTVSGGTAIWSAAGTGTVTSVGLADSAGLFNITNTPVTSIGTLTLASYKNQSANNFLAGPASGTGAAAFRSLATQDFVAPTLQKFIATGTTTGWLFTISTSSTCAIGDTYTNNSNTYTVLGALSAQSGQVLFMSGASTPQASGTLTRTTGAGTSSITFSLATALATYTTPTSPRVPLYITIELLGAGGGGGAAGAGAGAGGSASGSFFGANILSGLGGAGGAVSGVSQGLGGTATLNSPAVGIAMSGNPGEVVAGQVGNSTPGGMGGSSRLGGAGACGLSTPTVGGNAFTNSGSGGGGAGGGVSVNGGCGGGAGGYIDAKIFSPGTSYSYVIGIGGTAGAAGTTAGGSGADGIIIITEYYQ